MSVASTSQDSAACSLAEVAVATQSFERICIFHGGSEISLGEALARHASGHMFNGIGVTVTVRNRRLNNVVLDADSLILFQAGRAIPETAYFEPAYAIRQLPEPVELAAVPEHEDIILGYNNAHAGYQHWLTQCVPAIDWSLRQARTCQARLILPRLAPWQEDFLVLLGHQFALRLTPQAGVRYWLPQVEISEFLNGTTSFAVCLSALETARRIANAVPLSPSNAKVLYIKAANPYYGSIRNEAKVIDLFRARDVTIVESKEMNTAERINLFRNADAVIGPLGDGLTDVLFCRPGSLLWEWMPRYHQNASFNRLAQAAQVDYWGDMFEASTEPGQWEVDLGLVARRLTELSIRLAQQAATETTHPERSLKVMRDLTSRPIDELMLDFESLGDNCEFGLVQRQAGAEPLGLLRFNGFFVPPEFRLEKLVSALQRKFDGLAAPGTITVFADGIPGQRELIVRESVFEFWYHTGIAEGMVELETQTRREAVRLGFLRRKLLEDLTTGDKIWVWKSQAATHHDQMQPLLDILRGLGPNILLWVVEADDAHLPGTVEPLEPDFIKGYIARFAPYDGVTNIDVASWLVVCWRADEFRNPARAVPEPEGNQATPAPPTSAMQFLAQHRPSELLPIRNRKTSMLARILAWLRRRTPTR